MQDATSNPYWHLTAKELEPFERPYSMDRAEIEEHRERIKAETVMGNAKKESGLFNRFLEWVA